MGGSESKGKSWSEELHGALAGTALSNSQKVNMISKVKEIIGSILGDVKIKVNIDGHWLDEIGTGENVLELYAAKNGEFAFNWGQRTVPSRIAGFAWSIWDVVVEVVQKFKEAPMIEWHWH